MASNAQAAEGSQVSAEAAMAGILALLVDERENRIAGQKDAQKTELLLKAAGLSVDEISAVTGRKRDAVRKTIERARGK